MSNVIFPNQTTRKKPAGTITDKCLLLDLDETLVHSFIPNPENPDSVSLLDDLGIMTDPQLIDLRRRTYAIVMDDVVDKKGTGTKYEMWGVARPHLKEFLITCFNYFKVVAVWSAGRKKYVEAIVDFLFKDVRRPHVIFTYDDLEKTHNGTFTKPIEKMIKGVPGLNKYMSLSNTFIIDDRKSTFESVNPDNGILIPPYKPPFTVKALRTDDVCLQQLVSWLYRPEVIKARDIRRLDKSQIFNPLVK